MSVAEPTLFERSARCGLLECSEPIARAGFCDLHVTKLPDDLRERWLRSWDGKAPGDWTKMLHEVCVAARAGENATPPAPEVPMGQLELA